MHKIQQLFQIYKNMGSEYALFRTQYELKRKLGILKKQFPVKYNEKTFITLDEWKKLPVKFFFDSRESLSFPKNRFNELKEEYENYLHGKLKYFNAKYYEIGKEYDWLTNPLTGYKYSTEKHWSEVNDYDPNEGDIKYVWEKSRFSFLYMLIRYDYHFDQDNSKLVFDEILSWLDNNPINMGPNYKCSQEISLRILNWTFALYYYKNSTTLTDAVFNKIINSIYLQLQHVYNNIDFSRKAVRNNHAITETLMIFLSGILFPFFPESNLWLQKGKSWFEKEIDYQIYEDGSFLQFSMNYHRVVIQLLTWAILLTKRNGVNFSDVIEQKAKLSLDFLLNHINIKDGYLPNYGANDGALFFRLNNCDYRDYRPQLNALRAALKNAPYFNEDYLLEDSFWFGINPSDRVDLKQKNLVSFEDGGYYTIRDNSTFTFIKCGKYKDRPSQSDNLHVDIWADGENILRDAGSYLYNAEDEDLKFFNGTISHNTIMLGEFDQMLKGSRFIWYYWSQAQKASLIETADYYKFEGEVKAYTYLNKNIYLKREILKHKSKYVWEINDQVMNNPGKEMIQIWNPSDYFLNNFEITAYDSKQNVIDQTLKDGWYSSYYGVKEKTSQILFKSNDLRIKTIIKRTGN